MTLCLPAYFFLHHLMEATYKPQSILFPAARMSSFCVQHIPEEMQDHFLIPDVHPGKGPPSLYLPTSQAGAT